MRLEHCLEVRYWDNRMGSVACIVMKKSVFASINHG